MKIRIFDLASGFTGYSRNISGIAMAIADLGVDVKIIQPSTDDYISDKLKPLMIFDDGKEGFQKYIDSDTIIAGRLYSNIHTFRKYNPKAIIGHAVLEGDKIPEEWVAKGNMVDIIWACSTYNKQILENNGICIYVPVIWHGFDENIYKSKWGEHNGEEKEEVKPFIFLFVGGYATRGDRKGADLLAWAFNVFNADDNVKLIFKINTSYNPSFDAVSDLKSLIKSDLHDKVEFITDFLDDYQMAELYKQADISVTPTLGEAFCQSILESMACGTPCIVTNYSGHLDYCNEENSWLIPVEKRILAHYGPFDVNCGSVWVLPSVAELSYLLVKAFKDKDEVKKMGKKASKYVHSFLKWSYQAKLTIKLLEEYVRELK
jgi:glycosyltransferase involved in cell wall biosynthesis